jgi:kinesin family protein 3/17
MRETGRDGRREREIQIREVTKTGFQVEGLIEMAVGRVEDFNEIIRVGGKNRLTKSTKMNEVSSRSHSILTVSIESRVKKDESSSLIRVSKLSFVDLAGS